MSEAQLRGDEHIGPEADFLFGVLPTPEWLDLGGDLRGLFLQSKIEGRPLDARFILMQADVDATLRLERFVAYGSIGYAAEGALGATLTRAPKKNLVSREHWLGAFLDAGDTFLARAGRMHLPFGLRTTEHTLWTRALTRTDINDDQQLGAALTWSSGNMRGELMGIAGNFQLRPDEFRERGYSTYAEVALGTFLAVGASSLITHRELDDVTLREAWRHSHGLFARWSTPYRPLVLLTEWDYTLLSPKGDFRRSGVVGHLQADWEFVPSAHLLATFEAHNVGPRDPALSWGGWLSYAWFFAPHFDLRLDGIYRSVASEFGRVESTTLLLQGHLFL
jgi:hypothetical protein